MLLVSVTVFFYGTGSLDLCPVLNLEDQRVTVCLVSTLQHVRHRWPYWECKTPANVTLGDIKACNTAPRPYTPICTTRNDDDDDGL